MAIYLGDKGSSLTNMSGFGKEEAVLLSCLAWTLQTQIRKSCFRQRCGLLPVLPGCCLYRLWSLPDFPLVAVEGNKVAVGVTFSVTVLPFSPTLTSHPPPPPPHIFSPLIHILSRLLCHSLSVTTLSSRLSMLGSGRLCLDSSWNAPPSGQSSSRSSSP